MYQRIRNLREDRDLTQAQLAAFLNIHQTTYSDYELGNLNIPATVLIRLAEFYETRSPDHGVTPYSLQKTFL